MSKSANKTLVGAFVVGAITLLCTAVVLFGSGKLFKESIEFVLFFNKSINGLNIGAPVVFRGVPVGQVTRISITGGIDDLDFQTPVYIALDVERMDSSMIGDSANPRYKEFLGKLLAAGLRARLTPQSMITGQLMVELDIFPPNEAGPEITSVRYFDHVPEIPTIPSRIDSFLNTFAAVPLDKIGNNILDITDQLKGILHQSNVSQLFAHLDTLTAGLQRTMLKVDEVISNMDELTGSYTRLADTATASVQSTTSEIGVTLGHLNNSLKTVDQTLTSVRGVVSPSAVPVLELSRALREFSDAARSIRAFINMLDRNPEALLRGKGSK